MSFITNTDPEELYSVQAFDWHLCGVRLRLQHHEQVSWTPTFSVFLCLKFCVQYKAIHKRPTACAVRRDVAAGRGPQGCRTFPCSIPECSLFYQRTLEHPHRNEGILSFPQERCYCMGLEPVKDLLLRLRFYMRDGDQVLLCTALNIGEPPACNDWCWQEHLDP